VSDERWSIYCGGFAEGNARENCWLRAASVAKRSSLCSQSGSLRGECLTYVARATSDSAPCADAGSERDVFACMMAAALHAKSDAVCKPFQDTAALERSCAKAAHDPEEAQQCAMWRSNVGTHALAACKAVATGVRAGCEALPARTDSSREACLHALAVRTKDAALCRTLHEPGAPAFNLEENKCVTDVTTATKRAADCAQIAHGDVYAPGDIDYLTCMTAAAVEDPSACDRLPGDAVKEHAAVQRRLCLASARAGAPDTGAADALVHWQMAMTDVALCLEAPGDDGCLLTVALNTRNKAACGPIVHPAMKAACAKLVAP
jgi:hypothetical protein